MDGRAARAALQVVERLQRSVRHEGVRPRAPVPAPPRPGPRSAAASASPTPRGPRSPLGGRAPERTRLDPGAPIPAAARPGRRSTRRQRHPGRRSDEPSHLCPSHRQRGGRGSATSSKAPLRAVSGVPRRADAVGDRDAEEFCGPAVAISRQEGARSATRPCSSGRAAPLRRDFEDDAGPAAGPPVRCVGACGGPCFPLVPGARSPFGLARRRGRGTRRTRNPCGTLGRSWPHGTSRPQREVDAPRGLRGGVAQATWERRRRGSSRLRSLEAASRVRRLRRGSRAAARPGGRRDRERADRRRPRPRCRRRRSAGPGRLGPRGKMPTARRFGCPGAGLDVGCRPIGLGRRRQVGCRPAARRGAVPDAASGVGQAWIAASNGGRGTARAPLRPRDPRIDRDRRRASPQGRPRPPACRAAGRKRRRPRAPRRRIRPRRIARARCRSTRPSRRSSSSGP